MRNYWLKILLGAFAIFAVGMIGVTLARRGIAGVKNVVEGSGPLTIPLSLVPFELEGERLGKLDHVTLVRESPTRVTSVELEVNLNDSLLARGLEGCRLAANIEGHGNRSDVNIKIGKRSQNVFFCVPADSEAADLVEYGVARLQPGDIEVPLLLPSDVVKELQNLDFGKGPPVPPSPDQADSIAAIARLKPDSIEAAVQKAIELQGAERRRALDSIRGSVRRMADSLRAAGLRRGDSARREARDVADSTSAR